jgi:hypothetical protein
MESASATHFGPGPRLAGLAALLRTATGAEVPVVADLADGLALSGGSIACLVLDLGAVPCDDLGLLRRLRARQPGLHVIWTGVASLVSALNALAEAGDEFRPWPLDVTLLPGLCVEAEHTTDAQHEQLGALPRRAGSAAAREVGPPPASSAPPKRTGSILDPDLRHIEAILAGFERGNLAGAPSAAGTERGNLAPSPTRGPQELRPRAAATATPHSFADDDLDDEEERAEEDGGAAEHADGSAPFVSDGPLLTHEELEAFLAPEPVAHETLATDDQGAAGHRSDSAPNSAVRGLPHWYRDQVADLADLVQRAELALHAADGAAVQRSGPNGEPSAVLAGARLELGRLRQFARTLGCLAAPPAAGKLRLDLGVLVEETLASLAQRPHGSDGDAATRSDAASGARVDGRPRFLFRSQAGVSVQADKGLLVAALDAVLGVAAAAAGAADVVRTEVLTTDAGVAEVRVDLPEGRLAGLEPARILEPYALRKRMPWIGAHALAAAGGILVGHGGDLVLERRAQGPGERARLVFVLRLPVR